MKNKNDDDVSELKLTGKLVEVCECCGSIDIDSPLKVNFQRPIKSRSLRQKK